MRPERIKKNYITLFVNTLHRLRRWLNISPTQGHFSHVDWARVRLSHGPDNDPVNNPVQNLLERRPNTGLTLANITSAPRVDLG